MKDVVAGPQPYPWSKNATDLVASQKLCMPAWVSFSLKTYDVGVYVYMEAPSAGNIHVLLGASENPKMTDSFCATSSVQKAILLVAHVSSD